jgi:hypothetical protein
MLSVFRIVIGLTPPSITIYNTLKSSVQIKSEHCFKSWVLVFMVTKWFWIGIVRDVVVYGGHAAKQDWHFERPRSVKPDGGLLSSQTTTSQSQILRFMQRMSLITLCT